MLRLHLDLAGLESLLTLPQRTDAALKEAVRDLTSMAHAKATEIAQQKLKTRRKLFVESLSVSQINEFTWVLVLDAKAVWVDEGMDPHDMLQALLRSPKAKTAKDGSKYMVVPFQHGSSSDNGPVQQESVDAIKSAMKQRGIPFGKVERDSSGRPKYGLLHRFDATAPLKGGMGPGQGHGQVGSPRQGMTARNAAVLQGAGGFESSKRSGGGTGHLQGVAVYQHPGAGKGTQRSIMTFRVASSKQQGGGRWQHPGLEKAAIFDEVFAWISTTWEKDVGPAVMEKIRNG